MLHKKRRAIAPHFGLQELVNYTYETVKTKSIMKEQMSYIAFHFLKNDFFNPVNLLKKQEEIEGYFCWFKDGSFSYNCTLYAAKGCR